MILAGLILLCVLSCSWSQESVDENTAITNCYKKSAATQQAEFCVVTANTLPQGYITDNEATSICGESDKVSSRGYAHPRSCCFYLTCKIIDFIAGKAIGVAYISSTAAGTFYNPETNSLATQSPSFNCPNNPCRDGSNYGKATSDGQRCYTYINCTVREGVRTLVSGECDIGLAFDSNTGKCIPDASCQRPDPKNQYRFLNCTAWRPTEGYDPNVSYYNGTIFFPATNETMTKTFGCPAGYVFDSDSPNSCRCMTAAARSCPIVYLNVTTNAGKDSWTTVSKTFIGNATVSSSGQAFFNGNTYFQSAATANAEISTNLNIHIEFTPSFDSATAVPGTVALLGNSFPTTGCLAGTWALDLKILSATTAQIMATMTTFNGNTASITSSVVINLNTKIAVTMSRMQGNLTLQVNSGAVEATTGNPLGTDRLKATKCGCVMGAGADKRNFVGSIDTVLISC